MLKKAARAAFHRFGGVQLVRWRNRRGLRILMYHRFGAGHADAFDRQCAHIRRHYTPLGMPRIADMLRAGEDLPDNAIVVTVDDGHRDFLTNAWPVLRRYGIPATVYLISGFVDGDLWPWFDQVQWMFANARRDHADLTIAGERMHFHLHDPASRATASELVVNSLPDLDPPSRSQILAELPERLGAAPPARAPEEFASLSWDDVRALAREHVDFGGHTVTHPILSQVTDEQQLAFEVGHSKQRIEHELGQQAVSFCYPNGRARDVSEAGVQAVRSAGYRLGVLSGGGVNAGTPDHFRLRRIGTAPEISELYFRQVIAGFRTQRQ